MNGLIAADVDGTLLPRGAAAVPAQNTAVLAAAAARGYAVVVASGRAHADLRRLFGDLTASAYLICSDGAALTHRGRILFDRPIPAARLEAVFETLRRSGRTAVLDGLSQSYLLCGAARLPLADGTAVRMPVQSAAAIEEPIYKLTVYGRPLLDYPAGLQRAYQDAHWQEWVATGADKGAAVAALQRATGICPRRTAAFGDGENDLGMFRRAAYRCAVQAACPALKAIANHTAVDVASAVAEYINNQEKTGGGNYEPFLHRQY